MAKIILNLFVKFFNLNMSTFLSYVKCGYNVYVHVVTHLLYCPRSILSFISICIHHTLSQEKLKIITKIKIISAFIYFSFLHRIQKVKSSYQTSEYLDL